MSQIIACDFDGCLCEDMYPAIGEENAVLITMLKTMKKRGDKLILWTCRTGKALKSAIAWCKDKGLYWDAINDDVPDVKQNYTKHYNRKIFADVYIDEKSVNITCYKGNYYAKTNNEAFETAKEAAKTRGMQAGANARKAKRNK